ncbi:MAG: LamG domain-containing protein, partial [Candidatus Marinimicrobia bacterium]|nr:LamG domain-containing protein [Candidatus Neomarinimicrobiota bacterium]
MRSKFLIAAVLLCTMMSSLHAQYSLNFGSSGTVKMGDVLDMSGDFSISAWAYEGLGMIVYKRGTPNNYCGYMLHYENTNKYQFQIQEQHTSDGDIASADPVSGAWVHLVGVFDAGNTLKIYKNGSLAAT